MRRRNNKKLKISYFTFWVRCPKIPNLENMGYKKREGINPLFRDAVVSLC
jgi:hypothetical protein